MEIENSDNDNVLRIGVSIYKISGITIKATFGIWDTPMFWFLHLKEDKIILSFLTWISNPGLTSPSVLTNLSFDRLLYNFVVIPAIFNSNYLLFCVHAQSFFCVTKRKVSSYFCGVRFPISKTSYPFFRKVSFKKNKS